MCGHTHIYTCNDVHSLHALIFRHANAAFYLLKDVHVHITHTKHPCACKYTLPSPHIHAIRFSSRIKCTRTCMCTLRTLCMHTLHAHRANTCSTPARALLFQKNVVCIIRIYKHLRVGTHECVYACKYACLCVCLYARINVRTYVCMNACVCACICVYVHLCATHVLQRMHLRANRRASVNV